MMKEGWMQGSFTLPSRHHEAEILPCHEVCIPLVEMIPVLCDPLQMCR